MNKRDILDQLIELTELIQNQTTSLASYESRIPQIEIDITMSNLRKCYEYFHKLNIVNQSSVIHSHLKITLDTIQNEPKEPSNLSSNTEPLFAFIENDNTPIVTPPINYEEQHDSNKIITPEVINEDTLDTSIASLNLTHQQPEMPAESIPQPIEEPVIPLTSSTLPEQKPITPSTSFTHPEQEPITPSTSFTHPEQEPITPSTSFTHPENETIVLTEAKSEPLFPADEEMSSKEAPSVTKKSEKNHSPISTGDLFSDNTPTIGESMKPNRPSLAEKFQDNTELKTVEKKISKKPLKDIKEAIGINDKFLLINELFKGNQHHYNQALQFFNLAEGFDEANGMFSRMKTELGWKEDSKATQILAELIQRRHPLE